MTHPAMRQPSDTGYHEPMKYVSIFSGIEAASAAWEPLGWEPIIFSENDQFPSAVLKERYPTVPNLGDITAVNWREALADRARPDMLVGGSPCQSFSIAGSRTGLKGASGLMWEYVRAVRELRPRWILWENVPGALSSAHGEDFRCLLQSLDGLGYALAWRILDAEFFGLAQRRRRVFILGSLEGEHNPGDALFSHTDLSPNPDKPILPGNDGLKGGCLTPGEIQQERVYGTGSVSATLNAVHRTGGTHGMNIMDTWVRALDFNPTASRLRYAATGTCQTLTSRAGTGGNQVPLLSSGNPPVIRRLTPVECERLQGFPDGWTDVPYKGKAHGPDSARYRALGNSMAVPVMMWLGQAVEQADQGMTGADDAFHALMDRLPASEKDEGSVDTTPGKGRWMRAGACRSGGYVMGSVPDWTTSPKTLPLCEILEDPAIIPAKYRLSARACKGILTRAKDRGKAMDPALKETLNRQIADQTAD